MTSCGCGPTPIGPKSPAIRRTTIHVMSILGQRWRPAIVALTISASLTLAAQQPSRTDAFVESINHPAIAYSTAPSHDLVAELDSRLAQGAASLAFDGAGGYLRSVLDAIQINVDSQLLVLSQTS